MTESYAARIESKKRRRRRLKFALSFFFVAIFLSGGAYAAKERGVFRVEQFIVRGLDPGEEAAFLRSLEPLVLKNAFARFLGFSNYLAWPNVLPPPTPALARLEVEKRFFARAIVLTVEKRIRYGIWCGEPAADDTEQTTSAATTAGKSQPQFLTPRCYWFDERDGTLFEEAPETAGQLIPSIGEITEETPPLGTPFIPAPAFEYIKTIIATLMREGIGFRDLKLDRGAEEFRIRTPRGALLIFNIRADPLPALTSLAALRGESSLERFEYVDLTIPHKLLLKRR